MARYCSLILCIAVFGLIALGLTMLTSTSVWVKGMDEPYMFLRKQSVMCAFGLVVGFGAIFCPLERIRKYAPWMLAATCVLLVLCFVPGIKVEIYGSKRWIHLPGMGTFQPSELAKIVVVITLAAWFARWQTEVRTFWRGFVIPGMIAGVPLALIAAETDVGSALTLAATVGAIFYCVGSRMIYSIPVAILSMCGAGFYIYHNENRWGRIQAWLDLENPIHQLDRGMQQWRALLALGNGGPWGVGLGDGIEKFGTLTFAHIDFIFPVIGEELGLRATLGVIIGFVLIAVSGCGIALQARNLFNRCLALGLTCVLVVPAIQNIAVTTAVLPNDGLPLPFVSYGGTSLVFSIAAVGLLIGIHRRSLNGVEKEFPLTKQTRFAVRL